MAKQVYVEPKTLTMEELLASLDGEAAKMDYTEDAWSYGAPPKGEEIYRFKLFLDKDGIKQGLEDQKDPKSVYYQCNLICKIVEGEYEGVPVYCKVSTKIYRGKNISTMAGLIAKMVTDPSKMPNPVTPKSLAVLLAKLMAKEPIVKGELDWRGAYQYKDKVTGKDEWENIFRHYREFPVDPEDKNVRLHEVVVSNKFNGGTAVVRAQTQINRFFAKNEEPPKQKVIGANGVQVGGAVSGVVAMPELDLDTPSLVSQPRTGGNAAPAPVDDDLALMLDS